MLLFEKRNLITLYSESTGYKSCALFFALFFLLAPYFFPISEPLRPVSCYSNGLLWLHPLVHYFRIQFCVVNHYSARALLPLWQRYSGPASKLYWRIQNIMYSLYQIFIQNEWNLCNSPNSLILWTTRRIACERNYWFSPLPLFSVKL